MEIIFLLDTSGSMRGERINQLNNAMLDVLNDLCYMSKEYEKINVRIISFNNVARYIIGNKLNSVSVNDAITEWKSLSPKGITDTAHAVRLCMDAINEDYERKNRDKTTVVLVTDGKSSDREAYVRDANKMKLMCSNMKDKHILFIAVGVLDYDEGELIEFATATTCEESINMVYKIDDLTMLNNTFSQIFDFKDRLLKTDNIYDTIIEEADNNEEW